MATYKSTFAHVPFGNDTEATFTVRNAPWNENEQQMVVTGKLGYYGDGGHYVAVSVTAPAEVTDVTKASFAIGVHTPRPLYGNSILEGKVATFYVPIDYPTESVKIRVDWDGWHPETCEVFWVSAVDVELEDKPGTPTDVKSVYGLTKKVSGVLNAGVEFKVAATLSTLAQGNVSLKDAQFSYEITPPTSSAIIRLMEGGQEFTTPSGVWPADKVTIPAAYDSTTNFFVTCDTPGDYKLVVTLNDADGEVLTAESHYVIS